MGCHSGQGMCSLCLSYMLVYRSQKQHSHVFTQGGGGSQDDLLQGVSPSSTIRDIEAACGPLSAASGLLEATALPPAKDAAIIPLLWTRLVSGLLQFSKLHNTA